MRNKRRGESNGGKYSCALCFLHAFDLVSMHFKSGHSFVTGQNQEAWARMEWWVGQSFLLLDSSSLRVVPRISGERRGKREDMDNASFFACFLPSKPEPPWLGAAVTWHVPCALPGQLPCPSTHPSFCLLDIWSFRQGPSFPVTLQSQGQVNFVLKIIFLIRISS